VHYGITNTFVANVCGFYVSSCSLNVIAKVKWFFIIIFI